MCYFGGAQELSSAALAVLKFRSNQGSRKDLTGHGCTRVSLYTRNPVADFVFYKGR